MPNASPAPVAVHPDVQTMAETIRRLRAERDALREGVRALGSLVGVLDPACACADVAAGIERLKLAMRKSSDYVARLQAECDRAIGDATLARHERDHLRRELDTVNAAHEGDRP